MTIYNIEYSITNVNNLLRIFNENNHYDNIWKYNSCLQQFYTSLYSVLFAPFAS